MVWAYAWAFAWGCQAVLGSGFLLDNGTVAFVATCNFVFIVGAFSASAISDRLPAEATLSDRQKKLEATSRIRSVACIASVLLGLMALTFGLKEIGHPGLSSLFSGSFVQFGTSLVETKSSLNIDGVWVTPTAITVASAFLTCASVLSGVECALAHRGWWKVPSALVVAVLTFAFITSATTGIRNHLLVSILIFATACLAAKVLTTGGRVRISGRAYVIGAVVGGVFLAWVVIVQSARRGDFSFARVGATLDFLRSWFAGYLPALAQWSSDTDPQAGIPGLNLLRGILTPLGVVEGEGFSEQIPVVSIGNGATSNAMTIFRVLLLDFGYVGSIVVCAVAGFISQRVYTRVVNGSINSIVLLAAVYAAAFYSINYWFFAYGSRIGGVVLAFVVIAYSIRNQSTEGVTALGANNKAQSPLGGIADCADRAS